MERLTVSAANLKTSAVNQMGHSYIQVDDIDEAMEKLSRYEDTGLEPEEIPVLLDRLKRASEQWNIWCDAYQKDVPVWIPVEERLPGTERILITDGEIVKEGYRRPDGVWKYGVKEDELFSNLSSHSVVAWMPLPKPVNL